MIIALSKYSIYHLGLSQSAVTDLCSSTSSLISPLFLLQPLSPNTPRCCSTAAWLNLTLRQKHKPTVKRSELQTIRRSSAFCLRPQPCPYVDVHCSPNAEKQGLAWKEWRGAGPQHLWGLLLQGQVKKGLTSQMTHHEGAGTWETVAFFYKWDAPFYRDQGISFMRISKNYGRNMELL